MWSIQRVFGEHGVGEIYARGDQGTGNSALEEMQKAFPNGGLVPEYYRLKFENYMGRGDARAFVARTLLGKGVSFMEDKAKASYMVCCGTSNKKDDG